MQKCDRCHGPTKQKQITSKKTGREHIIYECMSGCMNGKYAYGMFPPRTQTPQSRPAPNINSTNEDSKVLQDILTEVRYIRTVISKELTAQKPEVEQELEESF